MKAFILAGGFGTRLRPVIGDDIPKCLAPVMGRPMITFVINSLKKQGITDITLSLHHKSEKFVDYFRGEVKYKIEHKPLGTGGAIKYCTKDLDEPVLVLNGDTVTNIDYNHMKEFHGNSLMTVAKNEDRVNAGVYILNPVVFGLFSEDKFSLDAVVKEIPHNTYIVPWFSDLGTPESYAEAPKEWGCA